MECVVLTGYSRGLGAEVLRLLVESKKSRHIVCVGRSEPELGDRISNLFIQADLSSELQLDSFDTIKTLSFSRLVFISNAGIINPIAPSPKLNQEDIQPSIYVNMISPMLIASTLSTICDEKQAILDILNVTSGAASRPIKGWGAYCAGKAGAKMFFDVMNEEQERIRVVNFDPGVVDTEMQKTIRGSTHKDMPDVDLFRSFLTDNRLRSPSVVAQELILSVEKNQ